MLSEQTFTNFWSFVILIDFTKLVGTPCIIGKMVVSTVAIFENCSLLPCFKGNSTMFTSILPFMLINCILTFLEERLLSSLFG